MKAREGGRTVGKVVLNATAVSETGDREILGVDVGGPTRVRALAEGHRRYLPWHREKVFRGGR